jgi:hypothetical protein
MQAHTLNGIGSTRPVDVPLDRTRKFPPLSVLSNSCRFISGESIAQTVSGCVYTRRFTRGDSADGPPVTASCVGTSHPPAPRPVQGDDHASDPPVYDPP